MIHSVQQDAPVLRLPNELLLDIFARGLPAPRDESETCIYQWEPQVVRYLKYITSVCSHWRSLAISLYLWRSIATTHTLLKEGYDTTSHCLRSFLSRSKNVTLDVYILGLFQSPTVVDSQISQRLVDMIFRHMHRCRKLYLVDLWCLGPANQGFFLELSAPMAYLTHLHVQGAMRKTNSSSDP